jgi:hypothetical protein
MFERVGDSAFARFRVGGDRAGQCSLRGGFCSTQLFLTPKVKVCPPGSIDYLWGCHLQQVRVSSRVLISDSGVCHLQPGPKEAHHSFIISWVSCPRMVWDLHSVICGFALFHFYLLVCLKFFVHSLDTHYFYITSKCFSFFSFKFSL